MKRNQHIFQFSGKEISDAAHVENGYHVQRAQFWRTEQDLAVYRAKAGGIKVQENDVTGGKSVHIVLDPTVQHRLECSDKIKSHAAAAERYLIEAAAYATHPATSFDLDPEDIVYFRLTGGKRPE